MSKVDLNEYKNRLKSSYGYSEDFAETLALMSESLADYYGDEYSEVVYDAVASCKYVVAKLRKNQKIYENVQDVLKREGMINEVKGESSPTKMGDSRQIGGVFTSKPHITHRDGRYEIDHIDRMIVLPHHFNTESYASLATLAHETGRLVREHLNGYYIEGDTMTIKSGLSTRTEKLSVDKDGNVVRTFESEIGVGFDRAATSYDELSLMRKMYDSNYDTPNYAVGREVAGFLADNIGLSSIMREAAMTKNRGELASVFDSHMDIGYEEFLRRFDAMHRLDYERREALEVDDIKKKSEELEAYFEREVAPVVRAMQGSIRKDEVMEYGLNKSA